MIFVKNTPNYAGVTICGDHQDIEELYDALHDIVSDEEDYPSYVSSRIRVLGVCYDLRHALMGDREIIFVDNGMDEDKMKKTSMITPGKNVYLSIEVLWPEMLFVQMVLNDFILLNQRKKRRPLWDKTIATVRKLQAAVADCLKQTVSEAAYKRMINSMIRDYPWVDYYATQYLDILNCRFIDMDREKRKKNITIMAKRLVEQGQEYQEVRRDVMAAARNHNCSVDNIRVNTEYPEEIDW
ncbi:MAG: hypothetical protein AB1767_10110 [Bacillota bacterium]